MSLIKHIILAVILLFSQVLLAPKLVFLGIIPNLLFPLAVLIGITFSQNAALSVALFLGVGLDLLNPAQLGLNTISMLVITQLCFVYNKSINKERIIIVFLTLMLLCFIYEIPFLLYNLIIPDAGSFVFLKSIIVIIYNTIAALFLTYIYYFITHLKLSLDA